jgi:Lrp/AsnC family leucine-responsive transcriptional regulator
MDLYDQKILKKLQENARVSYTELGKEIGLSGPAVKERVHKLEESGVIKGYKAKLDLSKLGFTLTVIINFKMNPGNIKRFIDKIKDMPEVVECNRVTGGDNLIMKVILKETEELEKLINTLIEYGVPTTSVVLSTPIEDRVLEVG